MKKLKTYNTRRFLRADSHAEPLTFLDFSGLRWQNCVVVIGFSCNKDEKGLNDFVN